MAAESQSSNSSSRKICCVHCDSVVSKSTYYRHRAVFFDPVNNVWNLQQTNHVTPMETTTTASQRAIPLKNDSAYEDCAVLESPKRSGSELSIHETPPEGNSYAQHLDLSHSMHNGTNQWVFV